MLNQAQRLETKKVLVQIPTFLLNLNIAGLNSQLAYDGKCKVKAVIKKNREKQIPYANTYIWNLKKNQNGSEEPRGRTGIKTQM